MKARLEYLTPSPLADWAELQLQYCVTLQKCTFIVRDRIIEMGVHPYGLVHECVLRRHMIPERILFRTASRYKYRMTEKGVVTSSDQIDASRILREQVTDPRRDYGRAVAVQHRRCRMKMSGTPDPVQHEQARTQGCGTIPAPLRDPQTCFHSAHRRLKRVLNLDVVSPPPPRPERVVGGSRCGCQGTAAHRRP
jgi:hypothetical protein